MYEAFDLSVETKKKNKKKTKRWIFKGYADRKMSSSS